MKGIILVGGTGSRLYPVTKVINKHLLPVYDKPMFYYPLKTLINSGIKEIVIVSGAEHIEQFKTLLTENGTFKQIKFEFAVQTRAGGIAQALGVCQKYVGQDKIAVILGDNIIEESISEAVAEFEKKAKGAMIFLKEIEEPQKYSIASIAGESVSDIQEKPLGSKSDLAIAGVYLYDNNVWNIIANLQPSVRGELEISDVNHYYLKNNLLSYYKLHGLWFDIDTYTDLFEASLAIAQNKK